MPTVLDKTLKRELTVQGKPFVLTLSPLGFTLIPKGRRKGHQVLWNDLVSGEAALATALNASLQFSAENTLTKPAGNTKAAPKRHR